MTIAELIRLIESKKRMMKIKAQEKATFDYILADLIGRSISRVYSSGNKMPSIAEAYPSLFEAEEIQRKVEEKKKELSVLRFKQFAQTHNDKYRGGGTK